MTQRPTRALTRLHSPTSTPDFYEARCEAIFSHNKTIRLRSEIENESGERETFWAPYDVLIYAIGATARAPVLLCVCWRGGVHGGPRCCFTQTPCL